MAAIILVKVNREINMKKNLFELLEMCDKACDEITKVNVGSVTAFSTPLKEIYRKELLQFVTYISMADGVVGRDEFEIIKKSLYFENISDEMLRRRIDSIRFTENYATTRPVALKYFVLADAGRKIPNDPNHYQNAQILADVYKLLGQIIIACHKENHERETKRLTDYMRMVELFLKEYGVYYIGTQKKFQVDLDSVAKILGKGSVAQNGAATEKKPAANISKGKVSPDEIDIDKLLAELNSYVGLDSVKKDVENLVNLIKVQRMREKMGLKSTDISKHMVFMGNPGTGKTTVARILSKIYQGLGVLKNDNFVEVDRSGLVCGYVGQTATKTMEVVEEAMGGILFIDEAYSLTVDKGENDFGKEAVDTLLKAMEDHRDDLVVIVAGYEEPMNEFLKSNPGLKSRFNKFLYFEDYTEDELVQILENMCKSKQYKLSKEAKEAALEHFRARIEAHEENFANAREVRNFLESAITNHASRVVKIKRASKTKLCTIEKEDLEK
ncbi:MAG: AAA family ATPase [Clostridiales bacterium]|nr:AAA family ATPase [Clostridiales bacterium]